MTNKVPISRTRQYKILRDMKQRCYNPKHPNYPRYCSRGISICEEWLGKEGAKAFYDWSLSHGYADDLTIDRVDSNEGYSPENCVWATKSMNSCRTRFVFKLMSIIDLNPSFEEEFLKYHVKKLSKEEIAEVKDFYRRHRKHALKLS